MSSLREAYRTGGLSGLASSLTGYVKWRLKGAPEPIDDLPLQDRLDRTDAAMAVVLMRDYFERATTRSGPVISVILPTRDRPERLADAIESVIAQKHQRWELVVVNDSDRPASLNLPEDERIVVVESGGVGAAEARNLGLDRASGEIITYLDDDNLMDPLWLHALALTCHQNPQATVLIGAQLVAPDPGYHETHTIRFPIRFQWETLIRDNFVDMGMLAHRRSDMRFDSALPALIDWDYVVRLTLDVTPVLVPALSGLYLTDAPSRISYSDRQHLVEQMRRRFTELRPIEPTTAQAAIGHHDVAAIKTMLTRLRNQTGEIPRLKLATSSPVLESIAKTMISDGVAHPELGQPEILLTAGIPATEVAQQVPANGFVVAVDAHLTDYQALGLPHTRPVGDHLWLGSHRAFRPEDLFEGATLVKFGVKSSG